MKSNIFIISGPSGVGKGTLINKLLTEFPQFVIPPSYTTRPPRPVEGTVKKYHFVNEEEFAKAMNEGKILESITEHGYQYGTDKMFVDKYLEEGKTVIIEIEPRGAQYLKDIYGERATTIFIAPQSIESLKKRITSDSKRGVISAKELTTRLETAKNEMEYKNKADYVVLNEENKVDEAYLNLIKIIANQS